MNEIAARNANGNGNGHVEQPHLEFLMLEIVKNLDEGKPAVAITNLAHAVWVARTKQDGMDLYRLRQLMRQVVDAGGDFD